MQLLYADRLRSVADKSLVLELFVTTFGHKYTLTSFSGVYNISPKYLQIGKAFLSRRQTAQNQPERAALDTSLLLHRTLRPLESLMACMDMSWMTILVSINF